MLWALSERRLFLLMFTCLHLEKVWQNVVVGVMRVHSASCSQDGKADIISIEKIS
jgi:hypothetical protein